MTTTNKTSKRLNQSGLARGGGGAVIDPTENVKALMQASLDALANLRDSDRVLNDVQVAHLREMAKLRADHAALLRISDLAAADKTRQVDVLAGAASAAALATAVSALQATSDRNAETLRNQLNATAATMAKQTADAAAATQLQTDNLFRRTDERVAALERAAATGAGRQSVADPQMAEFIAEMRGLTKSAASSTGKSEGIGAAWAVLIGLVGLVATVITIGGIVFTLTRNGNTTAPQVLYVPAPQVTPVPQPVERSPK